MIADIGTAAPKSAVRHFTQRGIAPVKAREGGGRARYLVVGESKLRGNACDVGFAFGRGAAQGVLFRAQKILQFGVGRAHLLEERQNEEILVLERRRKWKRSTRRRVGIQPPRNEKKSDETDRELTAHGREE